jgi:hypothetical protein
MRSLLFFALVSAAACSPYDPDLGQAPFLCGPADQNPRCPDGYSCQMDGNGAEYCLAPSGMVPVDANNLNCADDSNLEPNNDKDHAWQTPTPLPTPFKLAGLSICPAGDKDDYAITITTANQNLEVLIEFDASGAVLQGQILNMGGTAIAMASAVSGTEGMLRAYTPNLPTGVYYASVFGPADGEPLTTNNYKLTINVTGP